MKLAESKCLRDLLIPLTVYLSKALKVLTGEIKLRKEK